MRWNFESKLFQKDSRNVFHSRYKSLVSSGKASRILTRIVQKFGGVVVKVDDVAVVKLKYSTHVNFFLEQRPVAGERDKSFSNVCVSI